MIYLDSAATSLRKPVSVERAVLQAMRGMASPGRGGHEAALRAAETVYACREEAAALFHVSDPSRIVFTLNATHALNIALRSLVRPGMRVLISGYEHNAVTRPLHALGAEILVAGRRLFSPDTLLDEWESALGQAELAVCTQVSNVFGYILPIDRIAALCREKGVKLVVDASQAAGILPVEMDALGAAFIAMPGHKGLLGPQGTGLLLCGEEGEPLLYGGSGAESRLQTMPGICPSIWRPARRMSAGSRGSSPDCATCAGRERPIFSHTSRSCFPPRARSSDRAALSFSAARRGRRAGCCRCVIPGLTARSSPQGSPSAAYACAQGCTAHRLRMRAPARWIPVRCA